MQSNLHITVTSLIAAAVVWMSEFPTRLNPIILPLMASIKREQVATEIRCLLFMYAELNTDSVLFQGTNTTAERC